MLSIFLIVAGLAALFVGGETLVRGAARLAAMLNMPPVLIGLTVVSLGTSAPELAVCLKSVYTENPEIAIGNLVGSNISNVLLILGITSLIVPLTVVQQLIRMDVPIMVLASVLFLLLTMDGSLGRLDGALLVTLMVGYLALLLQVSRNDKRKREQQQKEDGIEMPPQTTRGWFSNACLIAFGLVLLAAGGDWLVQGAVGVATYLGISKLVIGLTIVAIGTSMPEVVTGVVAVLHGERDIAVGNVVGSNISNLLFIGGLSGALAPNRVSVAPAAIEFDMPVMIAAAVACLPIFFTGYRINRWEGAMFLGYFAAYMTYVLLDAAQHDALPAFSRVMWAFVLPLTGITILVLAYRAWRMPNPA